MIPGPSTNTSQASGLLAAFAVEPDGTLGRIWEPAPHAGWSSWEVFDFRLGGGHVAAQNADGRMELLAARADGRLGHCWQVRAEDMREWSHWEELGPQIQFDPSIVTTADGRLEVFAVDANGRLGHRWQLARDGINGWSEWSSFDCELRGAPTAVLNPQYKVEVFGVGPDGCLGHVWQERRTDGSTDWPPWASFGIRTEGPPAVIDTRHGGLEVFTIGPDGCLGHLWQEAEGTGWSPWVSFGVAIQSPPAVCRSPHGATEVFAVGPDGCLGHMWQLFDPAGGVSWSGWDSFGIPIQGPPVVAQDASGHITVVAVGADGRLGQVRQWSADDVLGWGSWNELGPEVQAIRATLRPWRTASTGAAAGAVPVVAPRAPTQPKPAGSRASTLSADFCVIGAGPAGITVAEGLIAAGASVVLVDSGDWHESPEAQALNHGDADGPIIKGSLKYLRNGRRRQVQGSAAIWGGWCLPFRAIDFEQRDWVSHSGWPITGDELAPFTVRAAETLDFDPFADPRADGPLLWLTYQFPPNLLVFRSRLLRLAEHPQLSLELGATAVEFERTQDRITSVRCARFDGDDLRVDATTVVIAAGGVENARILLDQPAMPTSPMLGRCFMDHPHVRAGRVWLSDPEPLSSCFRAPQQSFDVLSLTDSAQRDERLLNATVQLARSANGSRGPEEPVECDLIVRAEQVPNPESRIVLGPHHDRFGRSQIQLRWDMLAEDWSSVVRTAQLVGLMLEKRYGARSEVSIATEHPWPAHPVDPTESSYPTWGNHHSGTTRMSDDPETGVVDRNCRMHELENVYLAGSSVFPTGGAANATFTIVAMAHRLADHLAASRA
jgi:choline dehydrogenase-like flavoprotein